MSMTDERKTPITGMREIGDAYTASAGAARPVVILVGGPTPDGYPGALALRDTISDRQIAYVKFDAGEAVRMALQLVAELSEAERVRLAAEIAGIEDDRLK